MYYVRKLFLVAALAVTAMAMSASSASAILPVEVMDLENGGAHCPAVVVSAHVASDGCHRLVHSDSILLIQHRATGDVTLFSCIHDYELRLDENGEGWLQDQLLTQGAGSTPNCGTTLVPCSGEGERLWHVQIEHDGGGNEVAEAEFCLNSRISGTTTCEEEGDIELDVIEGLDGELSIEADSAHFDVESVVGHGIPGHSQAECNGFIAAGELEVDGHWTVDDEDSFNANVQIEHL